MGSLIKMYLYRVIHDWAIRILWIVAAVFVIGEVAFEAEVNIQLVNQGGQATFSLAQISIMNVNFGSNIALFSLAIVIFFYAREWKDGTFRNQILAGKSRLQIYLAANITSLIIVFSEVILTQFLIWGLGSAIQMKPLLDGESLNRYFVSLLMLCFIGMAYSVIATSFAFIVKNGWGAFGLLFAFFFVFDVIVGIAQLLQGLNSSGYYAFLECFFPYQISQFSSAGFEYDAALGYVKTNDGYFNTVIVSGRTVPLIIKTILFSLLFGGGFGVLGGYLFYKTDIK